MLEWKVLSGSHCQELGQLADLASNFLFTPVQPIRNQLLVDLTLDNDYNSKVSAPVGSLLKLCKDKNDLKREEGNDLINVIHPL